MSGVILSIYLADDPRSVQRHRLVPVFENVNYQSSQYSKKALPFLCDQESNFLALHQCLFRISDRACTCPKRSSNAELLLPLLLPLRLPATRLLLSGFDDPFPSAAFGFGTLLTTHPSLRLLGRLLPALPALCAIGRSVLER